MNATVRDQRAGGVPWTGIVVLTLSLIAMIAVSLALWDSLPALVTTQEATATRAGVRVSKTFIAAVIPATLVVVSVIIVAAAMIANRLRHLLPPELTLPPQLLATRRSRNRARSASIVLISPFLVVLHGGILLHSAGHDVPVPLGMTVAMGLLIAGTGHVIPMIQLRAQVPGWERTQRLAGRGLMVLGGSCVVAAFFVPLPVVAVTCACAAGAIALAGGLVPLLRSHDRNT